MTINADHLRLEGDGVISANALRAAVAGGAINITSDDIRLYGGEISTDAVGRAGAITLQMSSQGILWLIGGAGDPATITTSSAADDGGLITISSPYAIIADGSEIRALTGLNTAIATINSNFFVRSTHNLNLLLVDGQLLLDTSVEDPAQGSEDAEVAFVDPLSVLRNTCAAARETGTSSTFSTGAAGPYPSTASRTSNNLGGSAGCH